LAVIYGLTQIAQDGVGWLPALSVIAGLAIKEDDHDEYGTYAAQRC